MKKIGLVGGMGPESTIPYYHDIVYGVNSLTDTDFFPDITIESVNLYEVVSLCRLRQYDRLTDLLLNAVENLARCGASLAALTANTAHIVFEDLQKRSPIPIISIIDSTRNEASRRGYKRLALLGTIFTMENDFFIKPFREIGIDIFTPDKGGMQFVSEKIYGELEHNIVSDSTRVAFLNIIDKMRQRHGIDAVILGCTELPMLLDDSNCPVPCLDTRAIHVKDLINAIVAD